MTSLAFATATELSRRLRAGELSSVELVDYYIERIERLDSDINAVVVRDFERAREAAARADRALAAGEPGELLGVPMTIKESYDFVGLPTTWGIPALRDNIATANAEVVEALARAGVVFLGKTNVPIELSDFQTYNEIHGTTRNPWDHGRTPGGSSGGAAAALAAGLTVVEVGSDVGGSVRNPAHYCGVYGHKPTWGVVPTQGHALPSQLATSELSVCGPLARSAEDLALMMGVLAGPGPLDRRAWRLDLPRPEPRELGSYRVALWPMEARAPVERAISERVAEVGELLARAGATVSDSARPKLPPELGHATYLTLMNSAASGRMPAEAYARMQTIASNFDLEDMSDEAILVRAAVISHRDWVKANNMRARLRLAWHEFFDDWDVLICPQSATSAFEHDHSAVRDRTIVVDGERRPYFQQLFWSGLATVGRLPSTVFPTGLSPTGLPIGLQAIGAEYDDLATIEFTRLMARELGGFEPPDSYVDRLASRALG